MLILIALHSYFALLARNFEIRLERYRQNIVVS
jgi:hypothetical protein